MPIIVERRGAVQWLTLNRPRARNAIDSETVQQLRTYFENLRDDSETRVVVLRGAGGTFSAGLDLKEAFAMRTQAEDDDLARMITKFQRRWSDIIKAMRRAPQPIIALVDGHACGAGFALALACDVRYATTAARLNAQSIRIGTTGADIGTSYFLPRICGLSVASELMLTGRFIDGRRAERVGLVSQCFDDAAALEEAATVLAAEMASFTPLAVEATKDAIGLGADASSLSEVLAIEDRQQVTLVASPAGMVAALKGNARARSKL